MAKSVAEIVLITWSYINIILFYFKLICVFIGICVGDKERDVQESLNKWEIVELKALMHSAGQDLCYWFFYEFYIYWLLKLSFKQ